MKTMKTMKKWLVGLVALAAVALAPLAKADPESAIQVRAWVFEADGTSHAPAEPVRFTITRTGTRSKQTAVTDEDGYFLVNVSPNGVYQISVSTSYRNYLPVLLEVGVGQVRSLRVALFNY